MKAAITTKYGAPEVVEIRDITTPSPKADEVLVKIHATTITAGDSRIRAARFPKGFAVLARLALGIFAPRQKILGWEFSGVVAEIGAAVDSFKVGDAVVGFGAVGAHAEYVCVKADGVLLPKPASLSFAEAAALPFGGSTALYFLDQAEVSTGESILVNGASGAVGVMVVQIAKARGLKVVGVCSSANAELVKSLGAEETIDYSQGDIFASKQKYDAIFDLVGNLDFKVAKEWLTEGGRYVAAVAGLGELFKNGKKFDGKTFIAGTAPERREDLAKLFDLVTKGELKPVIGKTFAFRDIVEAHRHVDSGHKVGAVSIQLAN